MLHCPATRSGCAAGAAVGRLWQRGLRVPAQVGDLGVSKLLKDGMARTQVGTPYNMAPELWLQKPYAQSTDLWALGCMLYELITLRCAPPGCSGEGSSPPLHQPRSMPTTTRPAPAAP